ncbi:hypothetical protein EMIHUDRAFT_362735 [Emiliania huxleyi CCMP1516]|uniref:Fatty acid hydroxylase domain-containing protein n=2 Tax=Emiliania huxleyi TaxID=2903 RepID=A0A0D3KJY2_EMIH1|nr:hypothetical protein EMIHUDRAFT_362735 [Emiliania huxleyi CCMP1516]EOD36067.1 hypothetical protein EMIHUDRAFT_362735 [Emiliania huxleyi CCMP1516]|eukprot:XP_005788496.1 hypothetical protein EMIHUDRAFT_362735 [Emiliania huxleyi CCMP1516]
MMNATPADGLASLIQNSERLLALRAKLPTAGLLQTPTPRDFTDFVAVAACFLIFNLLVIRFTAPAPDVLRRIDYAMRQFSMLCFTILARWGWMTLAVYYSPWAAIAAWPLAIFETWSVQFNADVYEGRAMKGVTWRHASKCLVVLVMEGFGVFAGFPLVVKLLGWRQMSSGAPTGAMLLHGAAGMTLAYDLGLDFAFYLFHRACHENRLLYRWIHKEHHTDTGKAFGPLVAFETYTITWSEASFIMVGYVLGLALAGIVAAVFGSDVTLFHLALLLSWGHLVELLGHSTMSWTINGNPLRLLHETLGIELKVPDHTMHHIKPLSNYGKRTVVWDKLFGTYTAPPAALYDARCVSADGKPKAP